jgi:hypothetical protein
MVKDKQDELIRLRKHLAKQMPDPSTALAGSLMSRMIRCNKPGCRFCEKGKGKGHGPIAILSVSSGNQRVRQIPIPTHLKQEVEEGVRRFTEIQTLLKQISRVNQDLLEERKKR